MKKPWKTQSQPHRSRVAGLGEPERGQEAVEVVVLGRHRIGLIHLSWNEGRESDVGEAFFCNFFVKKFCLNIFFVFLIHGYSSR